MEKHSEDDYSFARAESGQSDYRYMSSESSEDPFRVCVHVLCEAGEAGLLQAAADSLLCVVQPELRLLRVSERGPYKPRPHHTQTPPPQPALALILFLREDHAPSLQRLHSNLRQPPWRYHHTERVGGRGVSVATPACQDFYTLAPGTPLWAVRQVHYGKEVVRFTVYCRFHSYADMVRLYQLLLGQRRVVQRKEDFCFCVVFSSAHTEVQLSLKRLSPGQLPVATESALLEFRVPHVGVLIPLLPRPCTPISSLRWQTHDYDNNKILLQVQPLRVRRRHTVAQVMPHPGGPSPCPSPPPSAPPPRPPYGRGPASYRNRRYHRNSSSRSRTQTLPLAKPRPQSQNPLWELEVFREQWAGRRSRSFCAPPSVGVAAPPPFRLNVAALVGAVETDVDTGRRLSGSSLDLSVVSAYSQTNQSPHTPAQSPSPSRQSAPPRSSCISMTTTDCPPHKPLPHDGGLSWSRSEPSTHTLRNTHSHTHTQGSATHTFTHTHRRDGSEEEEEEEFYI